MAIERLVRVKCDRCGHFLPRPSVPPSVDRVVDPTATMLFTSEQDAAAAALNRGWTVYPLHCPACKGVCS